MFVFYQFTKKNPTKQKKPPKPKTPIAPETSSLNCLVPGSVLLNFTVYDTVVYDPLLN